MATTTAAAVPPSDSLRRSGRAKGKKHQAHQAHLAQREVAEESARSHERWKSESQQKIYSTKLMEALTRLHLYGEGGGGGGRGGEDQGAAPVLVRGRTVREVADRALAFAARGRTRWSRAVLMKTASRVKVNFRKAAGRGAKGRGAAAGVVAVASSSGGRWRGKKGKVSVGRLMGKGAAGFQSKVRFLGGLVPGCRKEPINVVLEEATDYIPALEMQVRTMNALALLVSGGDAIGSSSGAGSGQMI